MCYPWADGFSYHEYLFIIVRYSFLYVLDLIIQSIYRRYSIQFGQRIRSPFYIVSYISPYRCLYINGQYKRKLKNKSKPFLYTFSIGIYQISYIELVAYSARPFQTRYCRQLATANDLRLQHIGLQLNHTQLRTVLVPSRKLTSHSTGTIKELVASFASILAQAECICRKHYKSNKQHSFIYKHILNQKVSSFHFWRERIISITFFGSYSKFTASFCYISLYTAYQYIQKSQLLSRL